MDSKDPLFQKLWRVASIQGHFDPWHPRLLERTEAQLDLILEAYSTDHPKELQFERRKTREARDRPLQILKGWADVLIGDAKSKLLKQVSFELPQRFNQSRKDAIPTRIPMPPVVNAVKPKHKTAPAVVPRAAPRRK